MDLTPTGSAEVVVAMKRGRFFRSRLYRLLMGKNLEEHSVHLEALNDPATGSAAACKMTSPSGSASR
jgi:hypothetical protein